VNQQLMAWGGSAGVRGGWNRDGKKSQRISLFFDLVIYVICVALWIESRFIPSFDGFSFNC
jgi:hypothetical protein